MMYRKFIPTVSAMLALSFILASCGLVISSDKAGDTAAQAVAATDNVTTADPD